MYRRMRKALIREIAPVTVLDWVEAEEYVIAQYQSMRFRNWQKVILERCQWDGIKRGVDAHHASEDSGVRARTRARV
jgi:hypothetical protein